MSLHSSSPRDAPWMTLSQHDCMTTLKLTLPGDSCQHWRHSGAAYTHLRLYNALWCVTEPPSVAFEFVTCNVKTPAWAKTP